MRILTNLPRTRAIATLLMLCARPLAGQTTQIDLRSQGKGIDFSKAASTKPFKTGTTLPSFCAMGETFLKLDATPGQNIFTCLAANVWTLQTGGGLPNLAGNADRLLGSNGNFASWVPLGGDVTGSPQTLQVSGLRGFRVSSSTPVDGQVLRWNSSLANWEPGTVTASGGSSGGSSAYAGGDLFGALSSATVTRLQNKPVSPATPVDGQVLAWSQATGQWQPQTAAAGGTGTTGTGTATAAFAALNLIGVTYSSANTLTVASGCSLSNPCNVRFGSGVVSVTASATVTWLSGAGTAYFYITPAGAITIGSSLNLTCTGCTTVPGIGTFPVNTIPLYTWSSLLTGWDPAGGHDARAYLSTKLLSGGAGVLLSESGQQSTVGIDTTLVPTYATGLASLNFGTLPASSCSTDLTVTVPGAQLGDPVATGWPANLPASVTGIMRVSAANTVAVRLCNVAGSTAVVPVANFRATAVHGF